MTRLRGICIGAGYFSQFHAEAWTRIEQAEILSICDVRPERAKKLSKEFGIPRSDNDLDRALDELMPDFVDIITPPATHLPLIEKIAPRGTAIICQKPLAPDISDAQRIVEVARKNGIRLMVHENFRFQPWHREIKRLIQNAAIGERLHSLTFRSRPGDGWGDDAYLNRQPYFRDMPRLLIYETGIHFIDTFRFLGGEIGGVYACLRRLNSVIKGEDTGLVLFEFVSGALGLWDANRYNECNDPDPRYTFGEFSVEGSGGTIRLYLDGRMTVQPLGQLEQNHSYRHNRVGFASDCVHATLSHFVQCLRSGAPFETDGAAYLQNLFVQEAIYRSAETHQPVRGLVETETTPPE